MSVSKKRTSKAKQKISKCNKKISSYYSRLRLISDRRFYNQKKFRKLQDEIDRDFLSMHFYKNLVIKQELKKGFIKKRNKKR
jgi:flagellar biosynthesis chaperone FliJ|tara:strand:- start:6676 stop:6921 length:246 start_codon:yes stop_codon:yes gene_type:complete